MSTDRIEVTKKYYIPFRICFLDICKNLFQHGFGPAIRIGALSFRAFFCDRNDCRIAIYSCWRGENNIFDTMFSHHIYKSKCTSNIILIIFPRLGNGFTYCFQSCEMNTGVDLFFVKNFIHCVAVQDVCFVEFQVFSCNLFYSFQWLLRCVV